MTQISLKKRYKVDIVKRGLQNLLAGDGAVRFINFFFVKLNQFNKSIAHVLLVEVVSYSMYDEFSITMFFKFIMTLTIIFTERNKFTVANLVI